MSVKIKVENFQGIEKLEFTLDKVVALVGPSDAGKSSILRAIHCLATNTSTDSYIRRGKPEFCITFETGSNSVSYIRKRGSPAYYVVNGTPYKNLARAVPKEVTEIIGIEAITLQDGSKKLISIQQQFDSLLVVPDQINEVSALLTGLGSSELVSSAIQHNLDLLKEVRYSLRNNRNLLEEKKNYLSTLEKVDLLKPIKTRLTTTSQSIQEDEERLKNLNQTLSYHRSTALRLEKVNGEEIVYSQRHKKLLEHSISLASVTEELSVAKKILDNIIGCLVSLRKSKEVFDHVQTTIEVLKPLDVSTTSILSSMEDLETVKLDLTLRKKTLTSILDLISSTRAAHLSTENTLEKLLKEKLELEIAIEAKSKEAPVCPTCNQPIHQI